MFSLRLYCTHRQMADKTVDTITDIKCSNHAHVACMRCTTGSVPLLLRMMQHPHANKGYRTQHIKTGQQGRGRVSDSEVGTGKWPIPLPTPLPAILRVGAHYASMCLIFHGLFLRRNRLEQLLPLCAECVSRLLPEDGDREVVEKHVRSHRGVNLGVRPRPPVHLLIHHPHNTMPKNCRSQR